MVVLKLVASKHLSDLISEQIMICRNLDFPSTITCPSYISFHIFSDPSLQFSYYSSGSHDEVVWDSCRHSVNKFTNKRLKHKPHIKTNPALLSWWMKNIVSCQAWQIRRKPKLSYSAIFTNHNQQIAFK